MLFIAMEDAAGLETFSYLPLRFVRRDGGNCDVGRRDRVGGFQTIFPRQMIF